MTRGTPRRDAESPQTKDIGAIRNSLGTIVAGYSDAELIRLDSEMRAAARLLIDIFLMKKRDGCERPPKVVDKFPSGI